MSKYGTPWALLCALLSILLISSYVEQGRLEGDVEKLSSRVEVLQHSLDAVNECEDCGSSHAYSHTFCYFCEEHFPEKYAIEIDGEPVCPDCVIDDYVYVTSSDAGKCYSCDLFYDRTWGAGYGLCETCGSDQLDECEFCWEQSYTVYISGNYICLRCLGNVVRDMNLGEYLELWRES